MQGFLPDAGEMAARIRAYDWSRSSLGPIDQWPTVLRHSASLLLSSKAQIVLFWGPDLVVLYNDAYRPVFGRKHPWALGRPAREAWSEVWHFLGPVFDDVIRTGEAYSAKALPFFIERHAFSEETYFDVSYDPVRNEAGQVEGIYCIVSEVTGTVLGERRLALLRALGAPDIAVLDIGLPVMDGYELARRLRASCPEIRLIAVTGYGLDADRERSAGAGFDDHLVKPIDLALLAKALAPHEDPSASTRRVDVEADL